MKDEFTIEMHAELTIETDTELRHKAACVWRLLGNNYSPEDLKTYCALYGITIEQALYNI